MSRGRRAALVAAGVVLAGAGTLAALAHVASAHADRLLAALSRGLGREVRVERLGITLRGGVGVALAGVTIADDPAAGTTEPLLAARDLELRLRLLPLLARRVVVDRIVIDEPVVNLVRDPAGHLNVESLGSPAAADGPRPAPHAASGAPPPAIQLALLRLRHGTIRYRAAAGGRPFELTEVALDAREPRFGGPMPIALRGHLASPDLRLDDVVSEGVIDPSGGTPAYEGSMRAGPGVVGELALARLAVTVRARPPVLAVESATVELLGGTLRARGRVASGGEAPALTAVVDGYDLDLARLPAPADRPHPTGTLALHAELAGPSPGDPGFRTALAGTGRFDVTDGRVTGLALGHVLRDVLAPLLGTDTAARLGARYPDLFGGDDLRFTRLSGSGRLHEGRVISDDLVLAGPSYEARGAGSLGLGGDLALSLRLAASPALTDDLLGHSKARSVLVDAQGQLTIPLRVHGSLHHPRVNPEPEFASTVARSLLAGTGLEEAAGNLLQRLLGTRHHRGH